MWEQLKSYGKPLSFSRNSLIYMPHEPAHSLYLLCSGQVSLYMLSSGGRVLTLQVVEKGGIFGHSVLARHRVYDTFAEAIKRVHVVAVPAERIFAALSEHPELGAELVKMLGEYLLATSRRLDEVAFKSVSARLASVLLNMIDATASDQQLRLPRRTHQQLAEMTNSYRETVTKIINQFRADNLLDMDRSGITLLNTSRLREVAQGDDLAKPTRGRFCKI
jgi:CRP-like cAMP-binding protein